MRRISLTLMMMIAAAGCGGDSGSTAPHASSELVATLTVTPPSATLALGETAQMTVAATSFAGSSTDVGTVAFSSDNPDVVPVSDDGTITAADLTWGTPVRIAVTSTKGGVTRDTAIYVVVQPAAAVAASLSIRPDPVTDTLVPSGTYRAIVPTVLATDGTPIPDAFVLLSVKPADARLVSIDQQWQQFKPNAPGRVWIYGTAYVFGTMLRDSVLYTFGPPDDITIFVAADRGVYTSSQANGTLLLALNGSATFANYTDNPLAYSIDGPSAVDGGDVTLEAYESQPRQFTHPGTYTWRSNTTPAFTGKILVQ